MYTTNNGTSKTTSIFVDYYRSKTCKLMQSGYVISLLTADWYVDCRHFFFATL